MGILYLPIFQLYLSKLKSKHVKAGEKNTPNGSERLLSAI